MTTDPQNPRDPHDSQDPRPGDSAAGGVDRDGEIDAWLRQALRHAPDAAALPPDALRTAILAQARTAAGESGTTAALHGGTGVDEAHGPATASTAPPRRRLLHAAAMFWQALTRPAFAAGLTSILAATLIGLMWWDRPLDETAPASEDSAHQTARSAESARPAAPLPTAPSPRVTSPAAPSPPTPLPPVTPVPPPPVTPAPSPAAMLPPAAPPAPSRAGDASFAERAAVESRREAKTARAAPAAPPPEPVPGRDGPAAARAANESSLPRPFPPATEANDAQALKSSRGALRSETPERVGRARADAAAPSGPDRSPLAGLRAALASDGPRWSQETPAGGRVDVDAPLRRWLADVDAAVSTWPAGEATASPRAADADAADPATVRLLRDGRLAVVVRLGEASVSVESFDGPARSLRQASVGAEAAARLRSTLPSPPR